MNVVLKRMENDVFTAGGYKIFLGMIARASDETIPIQQAAWPIWNLVELAGLRIWAAIVARFDSPGIRTPMCAARIPFGELYRGDRQIESPDMITIA